MNGKIGTFSRNEERARTAGHEPVILVGVLKADDGVYPTGLLLSRNASAELVPLAVVTAEAIGVGDGETKAYTGLTLNLFPIEPGTVTVTDGVETFADDGCGRLVGSAGGSGTVNYKTGIAAVTFNANVADDAPITSGYITTVGGVLDEETDTALSGSGIYVAHGTVAAHVLKIGTTTPVAPSTALLMLLQGHGIYPV